MKKQYKFSLGYYLVVFFSIMLLESIFFSGVAVKEISYSRFRDLLTNDKIQIVIVKTDRIFGLEKALMARGGSADTTSKATLRAKMRLDAPNASTLGISSTTETWRSLKVLARGAKA